MRGRGGGGLFLLSAHVFLAPVIGEFPRSFLLPLQC